MNGVQIWCPTVSRERYDPEVPDTSLQAIPHKP